MKKEVLNENELKITNNINGKEFKSYLTEGFLNGDFMTKDEFCQRLEILKNTLIKKHKMMYGNYNSK